MNQFGHKFWFSFLVALLFTSNCFALLSVADVNKLGIIYFAQNDFYETPYDILVQSDKGDQKMIISSEGKKLYEANMGSVTEGFKSIILNSFKGDDAVYAVILRQKGVHGEQVELVNLTNAKIVFHTTSAWPLVYEVHKNSLDVIVTDEQRKEIKKSWKVP